MNYKVREYLIEVARKGSPVFYEDIVKDCNLNLDLSHINDRNELSKILGDIASFEHQNNRPLLSALAIYKATKDHADGFYAISEALGLGEKKKLKDRLFGFEEINSCKKFWGNDDNYSKYSQLGNTKAEEYKQSFFERSEIEFLANWAGRVYEKENPEHVSAKNFIMDSLGTKTVFWSNELIKLLPDYETFNWRMWSQKGWDNSSGINKQVARFKPYTWARIYKKGDGNKDIFFTIGVDSNELALVYKLDYYFESNSHLSEDQKEIIKNHIPENLKWNVISIDELENLNWQKLIHITSNFIAENSEVYDKLISLAWGGKEVKDVFTNNLRKCDPPIIKFSELPKLNPSFKEVEIDFIEKANQNKEIGDAGEQLVLGYEKGKLRALGKSGLANKVEKVKDGRGFDIISFDENGNEFFIEVKTTTGNHNTPFDISLNEYLFAEQNKENYYVYRLYNFDDQLINADFFIIDNPINRLLFQPTSFRAFYKK